ncbi:hypothetical protein ACH5RR_027877 [Cinchona calisaya]|uniref:RNase H type-1 domain-containing protein n=1 Tax=Cinchona calisaya TaxID=153742 RepID=A0ABD2YM47_9GENT
MGKRGKYDGQFNKLEAIRLAFIKARDTGWKDIIVKNDDKKIMESLKKKRRINGKLEMPTEDILELNVLFQNCSFCFKNKDGMIISSKIANFAKGLITDVEWEHFFPIWIAMQS